MRKKTLKKMSNRDIIKEGKYKRDYVRNNVIKKYKRQKMYKKDIKIRQYKLLGIISS